MLLYCLDYKSNNNLTNIQKKQTQLAVESSIVHRKLERIWNRLKIKFQILLSIVYKYNKQIIRYTFDYILEIYQYQYNI